MMYHRVPSDHRAAVLSGPRPRTWLPVARLGVTRLHGLGRILVCLSLFLVPLGLSLLSPGNFGAPLPAAAQAQICTSSVSDTGTYSLRTCLTSPAAGAAVAGDIPISATVEVEWGYAPDIQHVQFYYTEESRESRAAVLRAYAEPYVFTLPTERWTDGMYRVEVIVRMRDAFETKPVGFSVSTANDVSSRPMSLGRWRPFSVRGEEPVVVGAVGDAAGGMPASYDVADLITGWEPDMFVYLGDVYNVGSYAEFVNHYEPTLGPMKDITNPVPGDHEGGRNFQGYLEYWNSSQLYYSARAGDWRLFVINSTEKYGQTSPGTAQFKWLSEQLANTDDSACTMVLTHHPRWGQSRHSDYTYMDDLWRLMVEEDVDVVLAGHEHNYQRWTAMDADGNPSADGTTQFVVGSGGHELTTYSSVDARLVSNHQGIYGALRLVLRDGAAAYEYVDIDGNVLDAGEVMCDGASEAEASTPDPVAGTIVNTNGLNAICRAAPGFDAATVVSLPEGTRVDLRGAPVGEWQPVRCAGQDGFVHVTLIQPDPGSGDDPRSAENTTANAS